MKNFDVCGLGNGLTDILLQVDQSSFERLKIAKGSAQLVETSFQQGLLEQFRGLTPALASGGSVANSIIAVSQLGGRGAFITTLADDKYGAHYKEEFDRLNIKLGSGLVPRETSGTTIVLITPDGERTMVTNLAVLTQLSTEHVKEEIIAQSRWLFIEGYVFANPHGPAAIEKAVQIAKRNDCKVALTCSDAFVVEFFGEPFRKTLAQADLLFANEVESRALTGAFDVKEAFRKLKADLPNVVVTAGPRGAFISYEGREVFSPAFPCDPKDLTGAGDMFAGTFLYGITNSLEKTDLAAVGRGACYLAKQVIVQVGARLHTGTREHWEWATKSANQ